jgi:osmotically-inducible protein OsmY
MQRIDPFNHAKEQAMTSNPGRNGRSGHYPKSQSREADSDLHAILAAPDHRTGGRGAIAQSTTDDDVELQRRVKNFLVQRSIPSLRRLTIEVDGTSVIIRGHVRTYYEKQLAVHCCQRVAGVINVVDAIEVSTGD